MTSIIWENKLDPSIEIMMIQRKTISACLNAVHDGINDIRKSCAQINEMLEQLKQVCMMHFRYEETLLSELHYAPAAEQKNVHDAFLGSIESLKCSDNQCHSPDSVNNFLQLRLKYIANKNNETVMLCDYITGRYSDK